MGSSQSRPGDARVESSQVNGTPSAPQTQASTNEINAPIARAASSELQPRLAVSRPVRDSPAPSPATVSAPVNILQHPALIFGAYSAGAGLVYGSFTGILQGQSRTLLSVVSTVQWGTVGTCFYAVRSTTLDSLGDTKETRLSATTMAAAVAGAAGTAIGGRRPVLPMTLASALLGLGGQWIYDWNAERKAVAGGQTWLERIARSKYSPMKMLTDQEYKAMLEEKLLKVEAEIAVLEDDIKALKEKDAKSKS